MVFASKSGCDSVLLGDPPVNMAANPTTALIIFMVILAHCMSLLAQNKPQSTELGAVHAFKVTEDEIVFQQWVARVFGLVHTFFGNR